MSVDGNVAVPGGSLFARWWPSLVVLAILWLFAINQLRVEWSINPQYTYGWTVPFLALYLVLERWKSRPSSAPPSWRSGPLLVALPFALLLFPVRLVQESAPDWRLVGWALGGACVAISLCAVYAAGGRPWLGHFAFPIAFFLVAVPWPVPIEQALVQWLMRSVTGICVEALGWCGVPALQFGNIIEISTGRVGVEEACSGVRSLQMTLMIALFMGELLRFGIVRRLILLAGGLGVAFACNTGRAFFLVTVSARSGTGAVEQWHDTVGFVVLVSSLAGVGLLCLVLRRKKDSLPPPPQVDSLIQPGLPPGRAVLIPALVWMAAIEVATEGWYRMHESRSEKAAAWSVRWPEDRPRFKNVPLTDVTRSILLYSEGRSAAWTDPDGTNWAMIFLRWAPGRTSVQLARAHGPEVCLPATGAKMHADLGVKTMRIRGVELPMRSYIFRAKDHEFYVFYCLWEQGPLDGDRPSTVEELTVARRLAAVRAGRRNEGQQVIEVAVSNVRGPEAAEAAVRRLLENTIES
ncbi:MAG: exosortase/archaeosortase family protein [Chthoniobacteraceae bacterium]